MDKLRKSILGKGNRATSIVGAAAIGAALLNWIATGELDTATIGVTLSGLVGVLARGGGTGSDSP